MAVAERAVSVVLGLAAAGSAVVAGAPIAAAVGALALYAGIGYYASRHPDVLRGDRRTGPDWVAGGFAGGFSFGLLGLVAADVAPWVLVLAVGFAGFGFVSGVAWTRADPVEEPT
ncbi:hypothetical protein [Halobacterium hubeiense]|uniref:hypothetical protein n=1 Tax=Halobacterium hubeiense TaxID=1407499 RepID=UPI003C78C6FD